MSLLGSIHSSLKVHQFATGACSSFGRALHSHCRGEEFESPQVHHNAFCFDFIASLGASPLASGGSFQSKLYCLGKFRESFPFRIWRLFHIVKQYEVFILRADGFRPVRSGTARDFNKIVGVISESNL